MSTTQPAAPAALFAHLVDDAAVFPPGNAAVADAVRQHAAWRSTPAAAHLGPLLVPAAAAEAVIAALDGVDGGVPLGLIARPGTPHADVAAARERLEGAGAQVVSAEIGHTADWQVALVWGLPLAVETPTSSPAREEALDEIAAAREAGHEVIAKMRTQATPDTPVPSADALAAFITACTERQVPFKLTGGLHHALPTTAPSTTGADQPEEQHGCLTVLLATDRALDGDTETVTATLLSRDSAGLVAAAGALTEGRARRVRDAFVSLGCCGVLDPLGELAELGLLDPATLADARASAL